MIEIHTHIICLEWRIILRQIFGEPVNDKWEIKPTRANLRKFKTILKSIPRYKDLNYTAILGYMFDYVEICKHYSELENFISRNQYRRISEESFFRRLKRHYS